MSTVKGEMIVNRTKLATVKRKVQYWFFGFCIAVTTILGGCSVVSATELSGRWQSEVSFSEVYRDAEERAMIAPRLRTITPSGARRSDDSKRIEALISFDEACRIMGGAVKTSMTDGTYCIRNGQPISQFVWNNGVARNVR
jgi:hypothetical protein